MSDPAVEGNAQEVQEMSLEKMWSRFPREWVAIIVTRRDANEQPVAGKVVAHGADRYRIRLDIANYKDVCILYAGEPPYPLFL
jgi:hypothetical protein